jgi:hypothetical protein
MTGDNHEGMVFIYALAAFLNECNDEGFELVTTIEAMGGRAEQLPDIFALAAERREQEEEVIRLMPFNLSPIARALGGQAIVERALSAIMTGRGIADAVAGLDSLLSTVRLSNLGRRMHVHLLVWYVRLGALDRAFAMAHELLDHYECLGTRGVIWDRFGTAAWTCSAPISASRPWRNALD